MQRLSFSLVFGAVAVASAAGSLHAANIYIPNGDFSSPSIAHSPYATPDVAVWQKTPMPDWFAAIDPSGDPAGDWYNSTGVFFGYGSISNLNSTQGAFLFDVPTNGLFQTLSASYQPGKSYSLSFGLIGGDRPGTYGDAGTIMAALYAGGDPSNIIGAVQVNDSTAVSGDGTLLFPFRVDLPTVNGTDGWANQNIGVEFVSLGGGAGGYWDIGNVQLTSVPEPASIALLGLGLVALVSRRRTA